MSMSVKPSMKGSTSVSDTVLNAAGMDAEMRSNNWDGAEMAKTNRSKDQRQNDDAARKPMTIINLQFSKSSIRSLLIDPVHFENVQPFCPFLLGCILPVYYCCFL